jgi:hypothetical protein
LSPTEAGAKLASELNSIGDFATGSQNRRQVEHRTAIAPEGVAPVNIMAKIHS